MQNITERMIRWAVVVALILLLPLAMTLLGSGVDGDGWHWTPSDFIFIGTLLFGAALMYELVARKGSDASYRSAVGIAAVAIVLLIWMNGAVGIIGNEDNPANLLYVGVFAVGLFGAVIARLEPQGMARTVFAMAIAQMLVPVIAFVIWRPDFNPGVIGVFVINAFFAGLFIKSALLFRRAK